MILIDTSAWIDFIRATNSAADRGVVNAISSRQAAVTSVVRLELLAGTFRGASPEDTAAMLNSCNELEQAPQDDVDAAAELFRRCRRGGETIRSVNDCLLAAIAIRHGVPILHCDRDFDAIARYSDLQVATS